MGVLGLVYSKLGKTGLSAIGLGFGIFIVILDFTYFYNSLATCKGSSFIENSL